ncbi:MAG: alpha/beta fold hydrolase [Candidatus Peregrinibacteria bacterium]|nr:alpha/beta fold hydrolase [Candidatus Peregrinibacteria bacterium]
MLWNIFSFKTSDGLDLYGGLIKAKKSQAKHSKAEKTIVVHVHGMTDFFYDGKLVETVAQAANAAGYDFFAFNNRGMGSVSLISKQFLGTSLEKFEDCTYDISGALQALRGLGYEKFILSGHSTGCQKITYYASEVKKFSIEALILMSPADDLAVQRKALGNKFEKYFNEAKKLVQDHNGDTILPSEFKTPMWSAKRFYHLFKETSVEGNIFNYERPITMTGKIKRPIMALFGSEEQYAVMSPSDMLKKIANSFADAKSKTVLIPGADHSFHGEEKALYAALRKFFTSL